jgi:hypothetical protein
MEYIDIILLFLILCILVLEVISIRNYKKDLELCYSVLIQQQQQINELESKLKKSD